MKKIISLSALALAALIPSQAEAAWGFTAHQGVTMSGTQKYMAPTEMVPTVDFKTGKILIQVDALETLASLTRAQETHFGFNGYYGLGKGEIKNHIDGVMQIGASVDFGSYNPVEDTSEDDFSNLFVLGQIRMGAQTYGKSSKYGFGIYVVPGLGFASVPALEQDAEAEGIEKQTEIAIGSGLQISVWKK